MRASRRAPLGRMGEIVDGIFYQERAGFVTGEILPIDGGQSAGHEIPTSHRRRGGFGSQHPLPEALGLEAFAVPVSPARRSGRAPMP